MYRRISLVFLLSLFAALSHSQEVRSARDGTSTVFGYVHDGYDGYNVQGAWVWVDGTNLAASTDSWGHYEIPGVPIATLSADFSGDAVSGPFPLVVQFHGLTEGGSPVVKITHPGYIDWREDQVSLVTNGFTNVSADLHPKGRMRISADWNYYQFMNPVTAYLKTPSIGGQSYQINSLTPEGSLGEAPYALFQDREGGQSKLICLTFSELYNGTYRYYLDVDKFGIGWGYDVPTIRIFDEDGLIYTVNAYIIGEGNYWHVCDINGSDGTITLIDQWLTGPPPMAGASGNLPGREDAAGSSSQSSGSRTFSWDFGDGGTSAEQNPVHTYSATGTYTVSLSVSDGVSEVITTKENYIGVGVSRVPEQATVSHTLWPNPASKEIHIDWVSEGGFRHGAGWQIFDSRGRMAMTGNWDAHMSHDLRIDISGLPRGIYFIRVTDHEGNGGCCKFIAD